MKGIKGLKRELVYAKFKGKCAYCGCNVTFEKFQVDHIKPIKRGYKSHEVDKGGNNIDNLYPSCASCNNSKSDFTIEFWRNELELKKQRLIRDSPSYNLLLKFGLVVETKKKVKFYFEKYGRVDKNK